MISRYFSIYLICVISLIINIAYGQSKTNLSHSTIAENLEWKGVAIAEENYSIWGTSPILDDSDKAHLFVARWPEMNVTPGWRKSSEIAHYVGQHPEGPFRFLEVVVQGSGKETWDKYGPHNPEIKRVGEYFVLVYIANTDYRQPPHPANQRIGMVISRSLYGPWKKVGENGMIIEKSNDPGHWTYPSTNGVSNPTFTEFKGKFCIYFKTRTANRKTVYGLALADDLEGPYIIQDKPVTDSEFFFEDPNAFKWKGKLYLIADDNFGEYTGIKGGGILWSVDDIYSLNPKTIKVGFDLISAYYNAYNEQDVTKIYGGDPKFERPKILMINDEPAYLYAPSGWNVFGGRRTVSYVLKINASVEKNTAIIPVSSQEDRASSAGWVNGGTWMNQHEDINQIGKIREVDLVFLGNSITQSWGGEGRHVWPVGGEVWKEYYEGRNAANFGISGDRTQHILWRIDNGNFDSIRPKVIVLLIGTNNLVDNTATEIIAGINAIVANLKIKLPETKILLMGMLPRGEKVDDPFRIKINIINAIIKNNEDRKHVFFINIEKALLNPDGTANKNLMADDCLHLRAEGYNAWAEEIEPMLENLLSY